MRRWQLDFKKPLSLVLAADARLSQTDYTDDQSWQLLLGQGDDSALTLQTQYGGRVGLASVVPIWRHDNRSIYQAQAYHSAPIVTAFAPGYLRVAVGLLPDLDVIADYWVADSHTVTGQFTLVNYGSHDVSLRLDLYGHVVVRNQEQQISILTLQDGTNALYLGKFDKVDPVVMVQGGAADVAPDGRTSARVGRALSVPAGGQQVVRWAHAGLPDMLNSVRRARYWLDIDWAEIQSNIEQAAQAIPQIETGHTDWDATIAFAYQQIVQSVLRATDHLPHPSFVSAREPANGYSRAGDGSDYIRAWSGQTPTAAYLVASSLASIMPDVAQGILRNYITMQQDDGFIDWSPGLGGQRSDMLAMPLLARTAWNIYTVIQDDDFVREVFPALNKFLQRWFENDVNADGDDIPEWQSMSQTGYPGWRLFNGGVDIALTESPDMVTYLLSEVNALLEMALLVGDGEAQSALNDRQAALKVALDDLWRDGRFVYRDRDTHATPAGALILDKAKADEEHILALPLDDPSRLVITVMGGTNHKPRMTVAVHGRDTDGGEIRETLDADGFAWMYGSGTVTTQTVFSQVDRIVPTGLSRVYRISVRSMDLNDTDMNAVLPLWSRALTDEQASAVVQQAWDELLMANGLALFPESDEPGADESGVWVFWNALICEGLLVHGYHKQAVDLLKRLLRVQAATLRETGRFTAFYHADDMHGMGKRMDIGGVVPLHLLMRAFGVTIQPDGGVRVAAEFAWGETVTIRQYGVIVERNPNETRVTLSDDETITVPAGTAQDISPAQPITTAAPQMDLPEKPPLVSDEPAPAPVKIQVEIEDEDTSSV